MPDFKEYIFANRPTQQPKSTFLTDTGLATGDKEVTGDYSSTKGYFYLMPPEDKVYVIERMLIIIRDATQTGADKYGGIAELANGMRLEVRKGDEVEYDMLAGDMVKSNAVWARHCFDVNEIAWGNGDTFVAARWTFAKAGRPLVLRGQLAERLTVIANDNLTGLLSHTFLVQGFLPDHTKFHGYDADAPSTYKSFIEPA